ncbi:sigma-70 family RNA polymerase sigma factor [Aquirufa sp. OSTEICH-129V]|uniref:Sigma-70 family RNA polymerase sigma factor n=1 Tax=Aquirufa avitistagni TaxID=3104728 RepID=A0ABW6DEE2_9BACT
MLKKHSAIDEVQVWDQFRSGDQSAFSTLYQHFVQPLYAYSLGVTNDKELIKDCLHDLFVELWRNHATIGPTTSVKFYLMASIKRKLVRHMETNLKHMNHHINYTKDFTEDEVSQESLLIRYEEEIVANKQLKDCMNLLSKRQREAISLRFFHNMDTDQISSSMRINPQSVYNLIFGGLRVMKDGLQVKALA